MRATAGDAINSNNGTAIHLHIRMMHLAEEKRATGSIQAVMLTRVVELSTK
jgi:hypothetical protein